MRKAVLKLALIGLAVVSPTAAGERFGAYQRTIAGHGPIAVQFGPGGDLYVLEQDRHRVVVYDAEGTPRRTLGTFGSDPGQLQRPAGLAVATDGSVFVSDTGNQRIVRFDPDGRGGGVWGSFGTGDGQFRAPRGLAVTDARIYVADSANHRIQVFDRDARFITAFGGYGTGPGQFIEPVAVAIAGDGSVLVTEAGNSRVQVFDPDGQPRATWGDWGFFPGTFSRPGAIAVHGERVYVVDQGNHRVQVFDLAGTVQYEFGLHALRPRQGEGHLHYPDAVAISADGSQAVVGEYFEDRVQVFGRETAEEAERRRRIYRPVISAAAPHFGPRCDVQDELLAVSSPEAQQVLLYDIRPPDPILVHSFGRLGTGSGQFLAPDAVLLEPKARRLLVADTGNRRLNAFHLDHDAQADIKHRPGLSRMARSLDLATASGPDGAPVSAAALAGGPERSVYLLSRATAEVLLLDGNWKVRQRFGGYGTAAGSFRNPSDLALSPDGQRLYVVDAGNHRVQIFDPQGAPLGSFGQRGTRPGQFLQPFGIAIAADGTVFVSDVDLHRIGAFSPEGTPLHNWGGRGIGAGQFLRPRGLDVDPAGRVMVVDHGNHRIQIFNQKGGFLRAFGPRLFVLPTREATVQEE